MARTTRGTEETWRCALVGGIVSIPLTVGLYWLSGMGSELSLNMAFVGGVLAGYLAASRTADTDGLGAGLRAGAIGALPGLWLVVDAVLFTGTGTSPLWFRVVGGGTVILLFTTALFVLGAVAGVLGGAVGRWLAELSGRRARPLPRY